MSRLKAETSLFTTLRTVVFLSTVLVLATVLANDANESRAERSATLLQSQRRSKPVTLQANSLCARDERIIFSCRIKRPAKIVSVCASRDLASERGYLQYRFGLPGKVELEFPKDRQGTQAKFHYTHYFRAQVDLTEINFVLDGYDYSVFDDYNGEEKPAISREGVTVTRSGSSQKEVTFVCRTRSKADYTDLQAVLPTGQQ